MTRAVDTALDAVTKLTPQDNRPRKAKLTPKAHAALSAELKALQKTNDELLDCLRRITRATKIRGPLGTAAYIISDEVMHNAQNILATPGLL